MWSWLIVLVLLAVFAYFRMNDKASARLKADEMEYRKKLDGHSVAALVEAFEDPARDAQTAAMIYSYLKERRPNWKESRTFNKRDSQ